MKSFNRMKNYLENYTRKKYFTDKVFQIRKDIGIPSNGILFPKNLDHHSIEFPVSVFGISYKGVKYLTSPKKSDGIYKDLFKPMPSVYQGLTMKLFVNVYILFNKRKYDILEEWCHKIGDSVCLIHYRMDYLEQKDCDCALRVCEESMDGESKQYPITIGISPYATQNEVIDLIKSEWNQIRGNFIILEREKNIEPFQERKSQLLKTRKRSSNSKEIEDIVYENKELSLEELGVIIKESTGVILDPGEISKTRSLAMERREKK